MCRRGLDVWRTLTKETQVSLAGATTNDLNMCEFAVLIGDCLLYEQIDRDDIYAADVCQHCTDSESGCTRVSDTGSGGHPEAPPHQRSCTATAVPEESMMVGCGGKDKWVHLSYMRPKRKTKMT